MLASPSICSIPSLSTDDPLTALFQSPTPTISISCAHEAASLSSFGWSDFSPVVEASYNFVPTGPVSSMTAASYCCSPAKDQATYSQTLPVYRRRLLPQTHRSLTKLSSADSSTSSLSFIEATGLRTKARSSKKRVSFASTVQIRTHKITLGEHPCCQGGMALTSDWAREGEDECIDFELFEANSLKRRQGELRLSFSQRKERLEAAMGLSESDLWEREYEIFFGCSQNHSTDGCKQLHTSPSVRRALAEALGLSDYCKEQLLQPSFRA